MTDTHWHSLKVSKLQTDLLSISHQQYDNQLQLSIDFSNAATSNRLQLDPQISCAVQRKNNWDHTPRRKVMEHSCSTVFITSSLKLNCAWINLFHLSTATVYLVDNSYGIKLQPTASPVSANTQSLYSHLVQQFNCRQKAWIKLNEEKNTLPLLCRA